MEFKTTNKIKIQFWRSVVNALPIKNIMLSGGFIVYLYCPICHSFSDITRTIWTCIHSRKTWKLSALWSILGGFHRGSFTDLFCYVLEAGLRENMSFCFDLLESMGCSKHDGLSWNFRKVRRYYCKDGTYGVELSSS